jgi:predicted esterase
MKPHGDQPVERVGPAMGEGRGVVILVHGRNAGPANILDLVPRLDRPDFSYVAPAAAGRTWYPYSFMAETAGNEPGISSGLGVLGRLVAEAAAAGVPAERVVLIGFSQGACLAAQFAMRHAAPYGGVVVFSGGLIGPAGSTWKPDGTFAGAPAFFGCSDVDPHVPESRVRESAEVFERGGAGVTLRIYPGMAHLVDDDEIAFAQGLLDRIGP